jgi:GGDEF domain-containing protein
MGLAEAKKYILELHKRQENPYLWPDFLTGLPDKAAIIKRLEEVYPNIGRYAVAYVRIANIHPYLIKYGPDKHAEIIQWAAAILKTTCEKCSKCFVGTLSTHDFVIMCETKNMIKHFREAARAFKKKVETFYTKEDLANKTTLSFNRNGEKVTIGLMELKAVIADKKPSIKKSHLLQDMGKACEGIEGTEEEMVVMNPEKARGV